MENFISGNKKKILIVVMAIVILIIIANLFNKKEVVETNTTTSPKTGWDAEYNPDFDDPFANQYQDFEMEKEGLEEEVF